MKVSVVIPVYNVKAYLERCVMSVVGQTFTDLEVVMVDDGSTDGSGELADSLARRDARIRVVHQANGGLSAARNKGLAEARGEYVVFLDSDDEWLLTDGLETLLSGSVPDADLIAFKRVDIWRGNRKVPAADYDVEHIRQLADAQAVFAYLVSTQQFYMSACFLMVRRRLLTDNGILFPVGLVDEDVSWSLHLWQEARTVAFHNLPFYGYYHRAASISTSESIRSYRSNDHIFEHWEAECSRECVNKDAILAYLANIWVSLGYRHHTLKLSEKAEAIDILAKHQDLLRYAATPKGRRTARLVKLTGVKGTTTILGLYWRVRTLLKGNRIS